MLSNIAEQHGVKVSVNDIVIKAVALALRNVPDANGNSYRILANIKLGLCVFMMRFEPDFIVIIVIADVSGANPSRCKHMSSTASLIN